MNMHEPFTTYYFTNTQTKCGISPQTERERKREISDPVRVLYHFALKTNGRMAPNESASCDALM